MATAEDVVEVLEYRAALNGAPSMQKYYVAQKGEHGAKMDMSMSLDTARELVKKLGPDHCVITLDVDGKAVEVADDQ